MSRSMMAVMVLLFTETLAVSDPIKSELGMARATHATSLKAAKIKLIAAMDAKLKEVAGNGDFDSAKEVKVQKQLFEKDGSLPKSLLLARAKVDYESNVRAANGSLRKAIEKAKRDYTKALKLDEAEALASELKETGKAELKLRVDLAKGGAAKSGKKPTLSDLLVNGAVFSGKSEHIAGPTRGVTGKGTSTVTSREGDSFTATTTWVVDQDKSTGTTEVKGKILAWNRAKWKAVDAPIPGESTATLRADGLYIDILSKNARGTVIKSVWKVAK